ncbi:hypothetical protein Nmel_004520, partial [Mimus melanotis]
KPPKFRSCLLQVREQRQEATQQPQIPLQHQFLLGRSQSQEGQTIPKAEDIDFFKTDGSKLRIFLCVKGLG